MDRSDEPNAPTPIPLDVHESWKGLHGAAQVDDLVFFLRGKQVLVRTVTDRDGDWRKLNDDDLDLLQRAGFIDDEIRFRMQIRLY